MKMISVMGSTGSIGTQTIDIIRSFPDRFKAVALTANRNWKLLAAQARELQPELVVIADERYYRQLREALQDTSVRVAAGEEALIEAATLPSTDIVLGALVGYSGLPSVAAALEAGKTVALANKETLVAAGSIISSIVRKKGKRILPVDSEHSAIFQCLRGEEENPITKIILTASGGPFRSLPVKDLEKVTVKDALSHPNWDMGAKVTIDSSTMMNKGFEMIEARWLFDCLPQNIEIAVHPQSIVHSMVEFADGAVKAQLGAPDMHIPIGYALHYPERLPINGIKRLKISDFNRLVFEEPDYTKFPLLKIAFEAIEAGGDIPAVMNAANEVAVKAFLEEKLPYTGIAALVSETLGRVKRNEISDINDIKEAHIQGTNIALEILNGRNSH